MKKALISTAAVAALLGAGVAQAETTVYGLLDVAYAQPLVDGNLAANPDSYAGLTGAGGNSGSRIGFKGSDDLGSGLTAKYTLEGGILLDDGTSQQGGDLFGRQAWFGLAGGFGEVRYGKQDALLFTTFIGYDLNGASNTACAACFVGDGILGGAEGDRALNYFSPAFGPITISAGLTQVDVPVEEENFNIYSFSATFAQGPLSVSAGYRTESVEDLEDTITAVAASYDLGVAKVKASYSTFGEDGTATSVGAVAPLGGINVGFQYSMSTDILSGDATSYEIFANKELAKNLYGYVEFGGFDDDIEESTGYAVGLIYTF